MRILLSDIDSYAFCFGVCGLEVDDEFSIVLLLFDDDFSGGGGLGGVEWYVDGRIACFIFLDAFDSFATAAEGFFFFFDFDFGGVASILMKVLTEPLLLMVEIPWL